VQFKNAVGNIGGPVTLTGRTATLVFPLSPGTVTASYSGDDRHNPSSGQVTPTIVFNHTVTGKQGGVTASGGTWLISGASLKSLTINANTTVVVLNSTVTSDVTAKNAGVVTICGSTIGGGLNIAAATGFVLVGDPKDDGCAPNTITGAVMLQNNRAGLNFRNNSTPSNVTVTGNAGGGPNPVDAAPVISGNTIKVNLTCSGNTPAPTNDGTPNTAKTKKDQCATL
jgi:hypothetical protein